MDKIDLKLKEENIRLGKYGMMKLNYLKYNKPDFFKELLFKGELMKYLFNVENQSYKLLERIQEEYFQIHSLHKNGDFMKAYTIRQQAKDYAEEIVLKELIYN